MAYYREPDLKKGMHCVHIFFLITQEVKVPTEQYKMYFKYTSSPTDWFVTYMLFVKTVLSLQIWH